MWLLKSLNPGEKRMLFRLASCVLTGRRNMNTSMTTPISSPLETLIIQQLTHLIHDEELLANQYPVLSAQQDRPEVREAFSSGLAELRRRAERLQRYVDALDAFGVAEPAQSLAS